jgi:hypothetical protein
MVAHARSYFFYYTAEPDAAGYGTLVAVPYTDAGFRYRPDGNWIDRGDVAYSSTPNDWWEYDFTKGIRLTHKSGFDGIGVNVFVDGIKQNYTPIYITTGDVYFEAHPNTATTRTLRVQIADRTYQDFLLQTGLDIWQ